MVNYSNGKIYKIESITGEGPIYIGSTTKKYLCQRMDEHRKQYKSWKVGKQNKTMSYEIFDTFGVENCQITLLETCPCETKDELTKRESHYIKSLQCINKKIEGRTRKEYDDSRKDQRKIYREENKEKIKEYKQIKMTCECGAIVQKAEKCKHERTQKHLKWLATEIDL
jgi:hypothetical protein